MKWALIIIMLAVLTTSCVKVHDPYGDAMEIISGESGLMAVQAFEEVVERTLVAKVKGSIYESGEIVSVFGSCLDAYDQPFINASNASIINASFSAWYPNGTQFIDETNVTELDALGHYLYTAPMAAVEGTYLTRLRCELGDQFALAFGEWQNPRWVGRINDTQNLVNDVLVQVNGTQALINSTFINLSNQITIVGGIANNTVDRNDSLLYQLILNLTLYGLPSTGPAGSLNFTEEWGPIVFKDDWQINVTVFIGTTQVGSADARCFINTTNSPPALAAALEPIGSVIEPKFQYNTVIQKLNQFDWDIWCEPI